MKIAIDARTLRTSTGRYIERLIHYLQKIDKKNGIELENLEELTEEEKKDRDKYRKLYMDKFRQTMRGHLDNIKIVRVDENGNKLEEEVIENTKYN